MPKAPWRGPARPLGVCEGRHAARLRAHVHTCTRTQTVTAKGGRSPDVHELPPGQARAPGPVVGCYLAMEQDASPNLTPGAARRGVRGFWSFSAWLASLSSTSSWAMHGVASPRRSFLCVAA